MSKKEQLFDRLFLTIFAVVGFAVMLYAVYMAITSEQTPNPTVLYSDKHMEVRAVCTAESGVIVTTRYNARIAGDSVSMVRMTPGEVAAYCSEPEQ